MFEHNYWLEYSEDSLNKLKKEELIALVIFTHEHHKFHYEKSLSHTSDLKKFVEELLDDKKKLKRMNDFRARHERSLQDKINKLVEQIKQLKGFEDDTGHSTKIH